VASAPDTNIDGSQKLKERHVNMIAFSACVGISFFLTCGKAVFLAGPGLALFSLFSPFIERMQSETMALSGLALVAYLLSGSIVWCVAASLGEMTALLPVKGAVFVFPRRFFDAGIGYACGWLTW
jgi:amino acid transporter